MSSDLLALLLALGATVLFGVAAVLQALATRRVGDADLLDPRLLVRLARQRLFLLAITVNIAGFGLHLTALQTLPLFLVQAVIAGSVAVTAVLSVRVLGTRLRAAQWGAVALVVAGLSLLAPTASSDDEVVGTTGRALVLVAGVVLLLVAAVSARRVRGALGAVLLGLVAGGGFGIVAICGRLLPDAGLDLFASPFPYVLATAGATAYVVYSAAMQRGTVTTATAAMVVTQTVVPALAGLALGDEVRAGFVPLAVAGFALALGGALGLARYEAPLVPAV